MPLWKTGAVISIIRFYRHFLWSFASVSPLPLLVVAFVAAKHSSLPLDFACRDGPLLLSFPQCCRLVNWTAMSWNNCVGPNCSAPRHCRSTLFFLCVCVLGGEGGLYLNLSTGISTAAFLLLKLCNMHAQQVGPGWFIWVSTWARSGVSHVNTCGFVKKVRWHYCK